VRNVGKKKRAINLERATREKKTAEQLRRQQRTQMVYRSSSYCLAGAAGVVATAVAASVLPLQNTESGGKQFKA